MKTKYQIALLVAASLLAGCSKEEMFMGTDSSSLGQVTKPGVEVNNAEKVVKNAKSRADYDISNYIVDFMAEGSAEPYASYVYSQMKGTVDLPAGNYTVAVRSHNVAKAEWDAPYFVGTSAPFTVTAGELTEVDPIKCVFSSMKVTVKFGEHLRRAIGDDVKVTIVANDEGRLVYTPSEARAGYFAVIDGSSTLVASFEGTVNGQQISQTKTVGDVAKGQHRIITFETSGSLPKPEEPGGNVDHSGIGIDITYVDENLDGSVNTGSEDVMGNDDEPGKLPDIPGSGEDPGPGPDDPITPPVTDEDIVFGGTLQDGQTFTTRQLSEYTVEITSKSPISDLSVQIISNDGLTAETLVGVGLTDKFSLANDSQYFEALGKDGGLGFPVGDEVKGQTKVDLDITTFMTLIEALGPNTNKFVMTVVDEAGHTRALTFTITYKP